MRPLILIITSFLLVGCAATTTVHRGPDQTLKGRKVFFVEKFEGETNNFNNVLTAQFKALGYKALTGNSGALPTTMKYDAFVTYYAVWYPGPDPVLYKLHIRIIDPTTQLMIAIGKAYRPYNRREDTDTVVKETLQAIFSSPDNVTQVHRGIIGEVLYGLAAPKEQ
ncbi:MAG: hypothetical protein ABI615_09090 [Chthoniobacterales bacterium]